MNSSKSVHNVFGCTGFEIDDIAGIVGAYAACVILSQMLQSFVCFSSDLVPFQGAIASAAVYGALLGASVEECLAIRTINSEERWHLRRRTKRLDDI